MGAPQPWQNGSVKNHSELGLRRTKSEGTFSQEHRHLFQVLPCEKRKLFEELNVDDTQGLPTKKRKVAQGRYSIGVINGMKPKWTVFRMLIPTVDDDAIDHYNRYLKPHFERKDVEVDFYFESGVGIVMVSAKWDSRRSINHAVNVFQEVHRYFLRTIPSMEYLTRLLVPAAHAKKLIILDTIKYRPLGLTIYLIDSMSVFFPGDVIVDVEASISGHVHDRMESVLHDLREFGVDESMMSKFKSGNYICPSYREISASGNGKSSSTMKAQREYEISEFKRIPLSFIDHIIGEDGANVEQIWKSSQASVYLETHSVKEVVINVDGETYEEIKAAKDVMEELIPDDEKKYGESRAFEAMFQFEREGYARSYGDNAGSPIY